MDLPTTRRLTAAIRGDAPLDRRDVVRLVTELVRLREIAPWLAHVGGCDGAPCTCGRAAAQARAAAKIAELLSPPSSAATPPSSPGAAGAPRSGGG